VACIRAPARGGTP